MQYEVSFKAAADYYRMSSQITAKKPHGLRILRALYRDTEEKILRDRRCVGKLPACSPRDITALPQNHPKTRAFTALLHIRMGKTNVEIAENLIKLASDGTVMAVLGAAHVPTFELDGRPFLGVVELLERAGYRTTPLYLCGASLCETPP
jgi:hypothetical protein